MILVAECKGWAIETQLLSEFSQHPHLFPRLPSQSRFTGADATWEPSSIRCGTGSWQPSKGPRSPCVLLIMPVMQFHLVPSSSNDWTCYGADYGRVESRKQTLFGYKLHLLVTAGGVIVDFELAPASDDLSVGYELLSQHQDKQVIGDKAVKEQRTSQRYRTDNLTAPEKQQLSRQNDCWVNGQLSEQFHIKKNHAHTFWGVCTRVYAKLTAHTLCIYLLFKKDDYLQIKQLAFPLP